SVARSVLMLAREHEERGAPLLAPSREERRGLARERGLVLLVERLAGHADPEPFDVSVHALSGVALEFGDGRQGQAAPLGLGHDRAPMVMLAARLDRRG